MMPKILSKLSSHALDKIYTTKKKKDPIESTYMVPAKNPPKVKLENFYHSRVPELG